MRRRSVSGEVKRLRSWVEAIRTQLAGGALVRSNDPFSRQTPGLFSLLNTFQTASPQVLAGFGQRKIEDWNPLSQRPVLYLDLPISSDLMYEFEDLRRLLRHVVNLAHEACHVLLWEPFFLGKLQVNCPARFQALCTSFEAYCFWYSDIVLTPSLRLASPDGEFVFARDSVSTPGMNPYRAFKASGVTDRKKILKTYVHAFNGCESLLSDRRDNPYFRELSRRIYSFHLESQSPIRAVFQELAQIGLFSSKMSRYLSIPGLPSVLPDDVTKLASDADPFPYLEAVFEDGMRYLARFNGTDASRVRARRALQTRAYFGLHLSDVLDRQNYFLLRPERFPERKIRAALAGYLESVEALLTELADGRDTKRINHGLMQIDRFYETKIRSGLSRAGAWVARRKFLHPALATQNRSIGLFSASDPTLKLRDIKTQVDYLTQSSLLFPMDQRPRRQGRLPQIHLDRVHRIATELRALSEAAQLGQVSLARRRMNRLLRSDPYIREWSVPLDSIDPRHNQFRELLFHYT